MGKNERQAYLKAIRSRYRRARKKAKRNDPTHPQACCSKRTGVGLFPIKIDEKHATIFASIAAQLV
jgi:hypothetical protein